MRNGERSSKLKIDNPNHVIQSDIQRALQSATVNCYALDDEEQELRAVRVAAPFQDHTGRTVAAISRTCLSIDLAGERDIQIDAVVRGADRYLSCSGHLGSEVARVGAQQVLVALAKPGRSPVTSSCTTPLAPTASHAQDYCLEWRLSPTRPGGSNAVARSGNLRPGDLRPPRPGSHTGRTASDAWFCPKTAGHAQGDGMKPETMRAVVLDAPGPPEALRVRNVPVPTAPPGWVLIKVRAFGVNRSELYSRLGLSGDAVTFPRVLGIEATGTVADAPGGEFKAGQQVVAMMGGMGRTFDGGYAEYTCVPAANVLAFDSKLDWATIGAVPEMLQTAYGSLTIGLDVQPGSTLLIRGGTSSIGLAAAILAKDMGLTVLSTTRRPERTAVLRDAGVDHPIVDEGEVSQAVRAIVPNGVDAALELVGVTALKDTLRAVAVHGVACFSGMLSNDWTVTNWYPMDYLPNGVRLTAYSGEAADLPAAALQRFLDEVAAGRLHVPIYQTYPMNEIATAHAEMEAGNATGKLVVVV